MRLTLPGLVMAILCMRGVCDGVLAGNASDNAATSQNNSRGKLIIFHSPECRQVVDRIRLEAAQQFLLSLPPAAINSIGGTDIGIPAIRSRSFELGQPSPGRVVVLISTDSVGKVEGRPELKLSSQKRAVDDFVLSALTDAPLGIQTQDKPVVFWAEIKLTSHELDCIAECCQNKNRANRRHAR